MPVRLFLISLLLSSAACTQSPPEDARSDATGASVPSASAGDGANRDDGAEGPRAMNFESRASKNGGTREFVYSWPAAVSRIPQLAARFDAEREREFAEQESEWLASLQDSPADCVTCISRGFENEWQVVSDLEDYLSLSADLYVYTGGAHGNYDRSSLVWDKRANRGLAGLEMFQSAVSLETALGSKLCDALDAEREKRRGGPVVRDGNWSTDCPGIDEASVMVGSSNGRTFDRIGIYFGPYVAGSYAEGAYELNFPVTASVLDSVKPDFADAFSVKR